MPAARARVTLEMVGHAGNESALQRARDAVQIRPNLPETHFRLAICLAHLDCTEEARAALMACEHLQPGFLESRKTWKPYADAARNEHFFDGLRRHKLAS